ncbi:hypothetical protein A2V56_00015 [Candidatus Woesebacteria bacterium RBG_19FT_COMBO_42_9]|nr:MAG: hypothetical protein A2V56_00015 [Candidatus Woesebacteria bacterium RBG_19FT_COMBO_42_9]
MQKIKQVIKRITPEKVWTRLFRIRRFVRKTNFSARRFVRKTKNNFEEGKKIVVTFRNFPLLLAFWSGVARNRKILTAVLWNGVRYKIGNEKTNVFGGFTTVVREVWEDGTYRLSKIGPPTPEIVFDIGAHVGVFSVYAAQKFPGVSVYSFEPDPQNFELLRQNITLNGFEDRIHPFQLAISAKSGIHDFFRSKFRSTSNSLFERSINNSKGYGKVKVESRTLEEIFEQEKIDRCDLLKMDCEGAEFEILLNAPPDVLRRIRRIALEYHDGVTNHDHKDLSRFLRANGFTVEVKPFNNIGEVSRGSLIAVMERF